MLKTFTLAAVTTAAMFCAAIAPANAQIFRQGSTTGPRGGAYNRTTQCAGGACTWQRSGTNPYGQSFSRGGSASCANGSCSSQSSGTGVLGRTWSRQGSSSCANGACSSNATGAGPNGRSYSRSGSASVTQPQ